MRKLSLSLLAASIALIPSAALAQGRPHGPPGGGGHVGRPAHGPGMMMRHHGPMMPGRHFQRRLHRGFVVPQFWWGPQFWISNWQGYGFADPGPDGRWIRYYDDAYLIDGEGRIRDSREGLDWNRYGEEWEMADGVPAYRARHDRDDDDDDEGRGEHHGGHGGHMERHGMMEHRGMHHGGPPMYGPGYGYGGGYGYSQVYGGGYGYGMYAYPIVIETITTSGAATVTEEVVEEYVSVRRHRPHRARCVCRRPAPPPPPPRPRRPPPGERG